MAVDKSMNILIADDYKTMLRIIRNMLGQLGFNNVDEVPDGMSAFHRLKETDFGLVIADWNMAPMPGLELLKKMRADEQLKSLPFIMVMAENKPDNMSTAKQAGVNNCITKPFNADTLKLNLATVLGEF